MGLAGWPIAGSICIHKHPLNEHLVVPRVCCRRKGGGRYALAGECRRLHLPAENYLPYTSLIPSPRHPAHLRKEWGLRRDRCRVRRHHRCARGPGLSEPQQLHFGSFSFRTLRVILLRCNLASHLSHKQKNCVNLRATVFALAFPRRLGATGACHTPHNGQARFLP